MSRNYKFYNPEDYVFSSGVDYSGKQGLLKVFLFLDG